MIKVTSAYPILVNDKFNSAEGEFQVTESLVSKKTTTISPKIQRKKSDGVVNYNILSGADEVMKDYDENEVSNFDGNSKISRATTDNILFGVALGLLGFVLYNKLSRK